MYVRKVGLVVLAGILSTTLCLSQQTNQPMTNQDVTEMVSAGFSDGLIVDKIHAASATNFDTSLETLKALQAAKVSDAVMRAMINPKPVVDTQTSANADFNDPASHHDPGIYMYAKTEDGMKMTFLEPTVYQGATAGGAAWMFSFGAAKARVKAVVRGAHAALKSDDSNMAFYFYFNDSNAGFGYEGVPTSPNEFTLLKFEQKSDSRETVVASVQGFHASVGPEKKANTAFTFTKIKPGVYKVTPTTSLAPGEYCFMVPASIERYSEEYSRASGSNRLFDFSVLPATSASMKTTGTVMQ
jgi:hypothetical protein